MGPLTTACCALVEIGDSKRALELMLAVVGRIHDTKFVCTRQLMKKSSWTLALMIIRCLSREFENCCDVCLM